MARRITLGTRVRRPAQAAEVVEPEAWLEDGKVDSHQCRVSAERLPSPKRRHPPVVESLPQVVSSVSSTITIILFRWHIVTHVLCFDIPCNISTIPVFYSFYFFLFLTRFKIFGSLQCRVLLNLRTSQPFEEVLEDLGQVLKMNGAKRMFTVSGQEVNYLIHFIT